MAVAGVLAWETSHDTRAAGYYFESDYRECGFLDILGIEAGPDWRDPIVLYLRDPAPALPIKHA